MHGVVFYIFDVSQCRGGTGLRVVRRHVQRAGAARPVPEAGGALNRCDLRARMCEQLFLLRRASFAVWLCCFRVIYLFSDLLMVTRSATACNSVVLGRCRRTRGRTLHQRGRSPCSIDGFDRHAALTGSWLCQPCGSALLPRKPLCSQTSQR
jgi:hypothetical protein